MGTTPKYLLPYPELTDVANVPADTRELAEAVEAVVDPRFTDTGWVVGGTGATILTANATNITLTGSWARRIGKRVQILLNFSTKVASNFPASGDIAQYEVGTLAVDWRSSSPAQFPLSSVGSGRVVAGLLDVVAPNKIYVTAVGGTTALGVGEVLSLGGTYLID